MQAILKKISDVLKAIFGYGIMISLLVGGLTFFGYVAALIIGGDVAALICEVIYNKIIPVIIYISTVMVLLGLLSMYLVGEHSLTAGRKRARNSAK